MDNSESKPSESTAGDLPVATEQTSSVLSVIEHVSTAAPKTAAEVNKSISEFLEEAPRPKPTEFTGLDVLPSSVPREIKDVVFVTHDIGLLKGITLAYVQTFCANCGKKGPLVEESSKDFAFYLCYSCAEKWSFMANTYVVPDEVWFERNKQVMLEKEGRELTGPEIVEAMRDPNHYLNKLTSDRPTKK